MLNTLFPLQFSSSMLEDVWSCDMYFFRKHCQHLVGNLKNPDLIAGSHFASACELVRKSYYNQNLSIDESIENGYNFILESEDTGSVEKSNEQLAFALRKYFRRFPLNGNLTPCRLSDGTYAVEYYFLFDLGIPHPEIPDTNISFRGQLDMLVEKQVAGSIIKPKYVLDEKTAKSVSRVKGTKLADLNAEEAKFRARGQFIAYNWAAHQLGVPTQGTIVRRVPVNQYNEDPFELIIPCNPWMIEQWSIATIEKINELVEKYKYWKKNGGDPHKVFYPTYATSCTDFNRPCEFMDGCVLPEGEAILAGSNRQLYSDRANNKHIPLIEFKKQLGLE